MILYQCLTGSRPFDDPSQMALLRKVMDDPPERPGRRVPRLPRDLELICLKCLEKDPAERYPTAAALADDLGRFLAGEPVSVRPAGLAERAAKWARRKPTLAAAYLLGLLTLSLATLGGVASWQWRVAERERGKAVIARDNEKNARATADIAKAEADRQRDRYERFEYGRTIEVAHQEWREGNVASALLLLESTRPRLRGWEWRYIHRLCHADLVTLKGHTKWVASASFGPDGMRIVTASLDGTVRVWDARSGAQLVVLKGHASWYVPASFSPDGSRVLTASPDGTVRVWASSPVNLEFLPKGKEPPTSPREDAVRGGIEGGRRATRPDQSRIGQQVEAHAGFKSCCPESMKTGGRSARTSEGFVVSATRAIARNRSSNGTVGCADCLTD